MHNIINKALDKLIIFSDEYSQIIHKLETLQDLCLRHEFSNNESYTITGIGELLKTVLKELSSTIEYVQESTEILQNK